jgi:hypothetical protein
MLTKKQYAAAARKWRERENAEKAERLVLTGYPGSHNPYLPHSMTEDCWPVCQPMINNLDQHTAHILLKARVGAS